MDGGAMVSGLFSTVASGLWVLFLFVAAVVLVVRGAHPRLGGLRFVGAAMILWGLSDMVSWVQGLLPTYFLYEMFGYWIGDLIFGLFRVLGAFISVMCAAIGFYGVQDVLVKLAGEADELD